MTEKTKDQFTNFNELDQWSANVRTLRSTNHQQMLGTYCLSWKEEDPDIRSNEDLLDAIIDELNLRNKADLFDYNSRYLDPEERNITSVLSDDTRHQMGRVLEKAQRPTRRLRQSLVDLYMWIDLAMKCREARRITAD